MYFSSNAATIGRRKIAPKERRKLASYEVAGTIDKIILSWKDNGKQICPASFQDIDFYPLIPATS